MKTWQISGQDFPTLPIAADVRFCSPDYTNDHIWELNIGRGEPPALSLQTTYGLRARRMSLFPRFMHEDRQLSDPNQFFSQPVVRTFYPNYLLVHFSPFAGIAIDAEYWAAGSQVISGRFTITNTSALPMQLGLEWINLLNPMAGGQSMASETIRSMNVLQGSTGNLALVSCMSGATEPGAGPYPALVVSDSFSPGDTRQFTWAVAALDTVKASFDLANQTIRRSWDAELTRIELQNESQSIEIQTGEPQWDLLLALSQKIAFGLFFPGGRHLPQPSFVTNREPDQGYSIRGDGSDYSHLWSGSTPLEAWYLCGVLGAGGADFMKGALQNFLSAQSENGFIDLKPGLGGQRSRRLAQPLLATLAYQLSMATSDFTWIAACYQALLRFVQAWFSLEHDRDLDGFPEWDHPLQTGFEEAPMYDCFQIVLPGTGISAVESPALASFLHRECASLLKIARHTGDQEGVEWLQARIASLASLIESTWDAKASTYRYRDHATHKSLPELEIFYFNQAGDYTLKKSLQASRRLQIRIHGKQQATRPVHIQIHGRGLNGPISESIPANRFYWQNGNAYVTTQSVFKSIKSVQINGLIEGDEGWITSPDYTQEDLSLLLPLWAEVPSAKRAKLIVEKNLLKRYLQPFGLSIAPSTGQTGECPGLDKILLPWNQLIIEGLVLYGYRKEASMIVERLMAVMLASLQETGALHTIYPAAEGSPSGESFAIRSLAPVGLFLRVVGIRQIGKNEVILEGNNPFPWPVTVKYQGMIITCHSEDVVVTFSTGHTITVSGSGPHRVSLALFSEATNREKGELTHES